LCILFLRWAKGDDRKSILTAAMAWDRCSDSLKNAKILLQILCTLPVTTMEAERLFSKVKRTATAARASMTEERMESLVIIQTHSNLIPSPHSVLERFGKRKHKMTFM
jgi:hypothetical protein